MEKISSTAASAAMTSSEQFMMKNIINGGSSPAGVIASPTVTDKLSPLCHPDLHTHGELFIRYYIKNGYKYIINIHVKQ